MSNHARTERRALAVLLERLGPCAPTLCEGWLTRDLAIHLVMRDRHPLAFAATMPPLEGRTTRLNRVEERTRTELESLSWPSLVSLVAEGPPAWNPVSWGPVDAMVNTAEFLVHHEDVRRAQLEWEPRSLPWGLEEQCWRMLRTMVLPTAMSYGKRLVLDAPGFGLVSAGPTPKGSVRLTGLPSEMLLWSFGRRSQADVTLRREEQTQ